MNNNVLTSFPPPNKSKLDLKPKNNGNNHTNMSLVMNIGKRVYGDCNANDIEKKDCIKLKYNMNGKQQF